MPELVNNHITTHDIPRNSYSVPVRARRSVTVESVVVTCAFDGDQILLFRFCGGWFLRAGRKRAPKYSYYRATQDDNLADATEEFKESVSRVCVFTPSVTPRRSSLALTTHNHISLRMYSRSQLWWMGVGGDDGGVLDLT